MEEDLRSKIGKFKGEISCILFGVAVYSAFTFGAYYQGNQRLDSMSPTLRTGKAQEYVESWKRAPMIMKYSPFEVGLYFSAKKYALDEPIILRKKSDRHI